MSLQELPKRIVLRGRGMNVEFVKRKISSSCEGWTRDPYYRTTYVFNKDNMRCVLIVDRGYGYSHRNYTRISVTLSSVRGMTYTDDARICSDSTRRYDWWLSNDRLERAVFEQLMTCMSIAIRQASTYHAIAYDVELFIDSV